MQVPKNLLAQVYPSWVRLLDEQANSILVLPNNTQEDILHQVTNSQLRASLLEQLGDVTN